MGNLAAITKLPLPDRIPLPEEDVRLAMEACNITLVDETKEIAEEKADCMRKYMKWYPKYTLPIGWRTVDHSWRQDLPEFLILDDANMIRFEIDGSWKGVCDNELRISIKHKPEAYEPRKEELIPSKTSYEAKMPEIAQALLPEFEPLGRKEERQADFV